MRELERHRDELQCFDWIKHKDGSIHWYRKGEAEQEECVEEWAPEMEERFERDHALMSFAPDSKSTSYNNVESIIFIDFDEYARRFAPRYGINGQPDPTQVIKSRFNYYTFDCSHNEGVRPATCMYQAIPLHDDLDRRAAIKKVTEYPLPYMHEPCMTVRCNDEVAEEDIVDDYKGKHVTVNLNTGHLNTGDETIPCISYGDNSTGPIDWDLYRRNWYNIFR